MNFLIYVARARDNGDTPFEPCSIPMPHERRADGLNMRREQSHIESDNN